MALMLGTSITVMSHVAADVRRRVLLVGCLVVVLSL